MKKVHLLPNVITAFGLSCGLFVIFKMNMTPVGEANASVLIATAGILLLAALADLLDGAVARAIKAESEFGGLFDSLSDGITFGVAPSVIILKSLSLTPGSEMSFLMTCAAMVFSVCGVLRLVRFNILRSLAKGNDTLVEAHNKNFTGLPIPLAAAAAVSGNLILVSEELRKYFTLSETLREWLIFGMLILLGYLMISRWKFPSLKNLHVRVRSFQAVFLTVLSAALVVYGILHYFATIFFIIPWTYLIVSMILSVIRLTSGKKSKTLEDFEPEPDELEE